MVSDLSYPADSFAKHRSSFSCPATGEYMSFGLPFVVPYLASWSLARLYWWQSWRGPFHRRQPEKTARNGKAEIRTLPYNSLWLWRSMHTHTHGIEQWWLVVGCGWCLLPRVILYVILRHHLSPMIWQRNENTHTHTQHGQKMLEGQWGVSNKPSQVLAALTLLTSAFVFSNTLCSGVSIWHNLATCCHMCWNMLDRFTSQGFSTLCFCTCRW